MARAGAGSLAKATELTDPTGAAVKIAEAGRMFGSQSVSA
jgi:hypothetical protein